MDNSAGSHIILLYKTTCEIFRIIETHTIGYFETITLLRLFRSKIIGNT